MEYDRRQADYYDDYYNDDMEYLPELDYSYEELEHIVLLRQQQFQLKQEWTNLTENCMGPVLSQAIDQVKLLLLVCLTMRVLSIVFSKISLAPSVRLNVIHCMWVLCGLVVIRSISSKNFLYTLFVLSIYIVVSYVVLCYGAHVKKSVGAVISLFTVVYILSGELLMDDPEHWHQIRGIILLLAMKIISLAFDIDRKIETFPSTPTFLGYCMHAGTVLFGPWISFSDYIGSVVNPEPISLDWLVCVVKSLFQSSFCLVLSTCVFSYIFIDSNQPELPAILPYAGNAWLMSYKDALAFHFSHYYISYLAQGVCMLSGFIWNRSSGTSSWSDLVITRPRVVEFPTSMLNVVVGWNIPMSRWLKIYIFGPSRGMGQTTAVFLTYVASALLHGLSFHLAAILLSLAFFTNVEYELRLKLSRVFNCVHIQARKKEHLEGAGGHIPLWAYVFNFGWVVVNLIHLSYLGSIFYSSDHGVERAGYPMKHTLDKWANLGYFSHLFAFGCFLFNYLT